MNNKITCIFNKKFYFVIFFAGIGFSYPMENPSTSKCENYIKIVKENNVREWFYNLEQEEVDKLAEEIVTDLKNEKNIQPVDELIKFIKYDANCMGDRDFLNHRESEGQYNSDVFELLRRSISKQLNVCSDKELLDILRKNTDLYGILAPKKLFGSSKRPEIILKQRILRLLRENFPKEKDVLLEFCSTISPFVLEMLFASTKEEDRACVKTLLEDTLRVNVSCNLLSQLFIDSELIALIKKFAIQYDHVDLSLSRSASETHVLVCYNFILDRFRNAIKLPLYSFVDTVYQKEQALVAQGYPYVLYSGRKSMYDFFCTIATCLKEIQLGRSLQDFQLLRFAVQPKEEKYSNKSGEEIRKLIINNGVSYDRTSQNRAYLMCLCCALAGNSQDANAESSLMFALLNENCDKSDKYSLRTLFDSMNMSKYFVQEEWEECEKYFKENLETSGNLLQLAFKERLLKDCVYMARPGGSKSFIKINGAQESDPAVILDRLRFQPFAMSASHTINDIADSLQARLVLTEDLLLNPSPSVQSDLKMFSYSVAGQEKREKMLQLINKAMNGVQERYLKDQGQLK